MIKKLTILGAIGLAFSAWLFIGLNSATAANEPNLDTATEYVHAFTEETAAQAPTGFHEVGTHNTWVVDSAQYWYGLGTNAYSLKATGADASATHDWDWASTTMAVGDGYYFGVVRFDDFAGDRAGIIFRAYNDGGTDKGYVAMLRGGNNIRLASLSGTTETVIATTASTFTWTTDTWYAIKVYADGSTIKVKAWDIDAEAEPSAWAIDTTSETIDNTHTGIGAYGFIGANDVHYDHLHGHTFDDLPHATPATLAEERANVWTSAKDRFVRWDGAVLKIDSGGIETVSEGIGYFLMLAVIHDDQATFDKIFNFALDNMAGINNAQNWNYLFAWNFDIGGGNVVDDWNYASDGDNDILYAVIAAHNEWGSAGDINYENYIDLIGNDLYEHTINTNGTLHLQVPYPSELTSTTAEINPSYFRPALFELMAQYQTATSTEWTQVLNDGWTMIDSITDNAGTLPTTAGLVPDWINYDTATSTLGSPTDGSHTTQHGFEVVRIYPFFELAADVYGSTDASDYMTGAIADFFDAEYGDHTKIKVEYNHDGTDASGNDYTLSYFNWGYAFVLDRAGSANASAFRTTFVDQYAENTTDATFAYFGSDGYYGGTLNMISAALDDGGFADLSIVADNISGGEAYIRNGKLLIRGSLFIR